jgi:multicomponent Na+:H+ antiporter subunit E
LPVQVLINIFIAWLWMFLQDSTEYLTFFAGYIVGLFILFCMRRFFTKPFYLFTFIAILKLFLIFIYELITSAILVIKHVIKPKVDVKPGIFRVKTDLKTDLEITLLSLLICLTPGSVVMEITPDKKILYVHGLNMPESKEAVLKSKAVFEKAIKDVTRK